MARGETYEHWTETAKVSAGWWQSICRCGWQGGVRESWSLAVDESKAHKGSPATAVAGAPAGAPAFEACAHMNCRQVRQSNPKENGCVYAGRDDRGAPQCRLCGLASCEIITPGGHPCTQTPPPGWLPVADDDGGVHWRPGEPAGSDPWAGSPDPWASFGQLAGSDPWAG